MSVKYNFEGHKVLVTGGGKGLGKTVVKKFIDAGCKSIFVIDRDASLLSELQKEFPIVKCVQVDVLQWEETRKAVQSFGPLDHVINNAGIPEPADILNVTPEGIDRIFGVNFKALVNVSQTAAHGMIQAGKGGTLVNISSVLDEKALKGISMYCCTKAAVTMLTKALALELAPHNIRVTCVRPSVMLTNFISDPDKQKAAREVYDVLTDRQINKRVVTVEDTADSILFLCSDASSMVNGSDILVDGGLYTH